MAKLKKVAEALSKMAKSDAEKILNKIDTPEKAIALKGSEREEYLNALDKVYGSREKRATDLGFGKETYYHGSPIANIEKFDSNKIRTGSGATSEGYGTYFTKNPETASSYVSGAGVVYPTKLRSGNFINESEKIKKSDRKLFENLIKSAPDWENSVINYGDENPKKALKLAIDAAMNSSSKLEGIHEIANIMYQGNINEFGKALEKNNIYGVYEPSKYSNFDVKVIPNPSNIRSVNAAFDPRFKDSDLILAAKEGTGSALSKLGKAISAPQRNLLSKVAESLGAKGDIEDSEKSSQAIVENVAQRLNLPDNTAVNAAKALGVAGLEVFADPTNIIPVGKIAKGAQVAAKALPKSESVVKLMSLMQKKPEAFSEATRQRVKATWEAIKNAPEKPYGQVINKAAKEQPVGKIINKGSETKDLFPKNVIAAPTPQNKTIIVNENGPVRVIPNTTNMGSANVPLETQLRNVELDELKKRK